MLRILIVVNFCFLLFTAPAVSHQVWCHSGCQDTLKTVEFFHKSKDVYLALTQLEKIWQAASYSLENGILAEFDSKIDPSKKLRVDEFHTALNGYNRMRAAMDELDESIRVLQVVDANCEKVEIFATTLERNLLGSEAFLRLSTSGVRFADAAGLPEENISPLRSIADILSAWRNDLNVMASTLEEVIAAMTDSLPLAERGQFAAVMLSGRNAFGEKMPQFTNMFSAYQRLYVTTVLSTISTTMQVYPNGYRWLTAE